LRAESAEAAGQHGADGLTVQRRQAEQEGAGQQRRVDLEVRVLRGGADQDQHALLDPRQEGVLLGPVEAVDLVEEEDRPLAGRAPPGKRIVPGRSWAGRRRARSPTSRPSSPPAVTADRVSKALAVAPATSRAVVVLPVPGGPHRITDDRRSASIRLRSGLPGP